jgi:hypothetical protein
MRESDVCLSNTTIDNGVWLADNGYNLNPMQGSWRKQFGNVMVVIKPNVLETFDNANFIKFASKQEFLAKSGRIPGGLDAGELILSGAN